MKIISEKDFPQDSSISMEVDDDYDDTPEENTGENCAHLRVFRGKCVSCKRLAFKYVHEDHDWSVVSLSALGTDEGETTGKLTTVLQQLKLIHTLFFNPKFEGGLQDRDVRDILDRLSVLQGCTLSFKHIFPSDFRPENSRLWLMAEELGAKVSMDNLINPITHVVTWFATAEEFQGAEREEIILVHPKWLRACYIASERVSEKKYLINPKDSS
nr:rna polymerase ii c-terminal domain phosphatase-like 4 [Quercus suber]